MSGAAQQLKCGIGDFLTTAKDALVWEVKGVNTLNGDLYVGCQVLSAFQENYKVVTAKTAHLWHKEERTTNDAC